MRPLTLALVVLGLGGSAVAVARLAEAIPAGPVGGDAAGPEAPEARGSGGGEAAGGLATSVGLRVSTGPLEEWREGRGTHVRVSGLPSRTLSRLRRWDPDDRRWRRALPVRVAGVDGAPPVTGLYRVRGDAVEFRPSFPVLPGTAYRVEVPGELRRGGGGSAATDTSVVVRWPAAGAEPTTRVLAVHPAGGDVPRNLLRLYVEFSAPMRPGSALEHVKLLDDAGRPVPDAFRRGGEELWDPDHRRLTILLDPGRIKRGLAGHQDAGPALEPGRSYTLAIDDEWPDARGVPLASGHEQPLRVMGPDGKPTDPARWRLQPPPSGSLAPLRVRFDEPLDHALAARMIEVWRGEERVEGTTRVLDAGAGWSFAPDRPWVAAEHRLRVDPRLEDLAGNSPARVFDADVKAGERAVSAGAGGFASVPFRPAPG